MFIVFLRTLIIYSVVLFALRIMGKSELSKISTFQMVVLFMIAELAATPVDDPSTSLLNGIMAVLTLLFLQILISFLSSKCEWLKNFINGKPSIIVDHGSVNVKEMERLRITVNDLFEQLRIDDCPSLSDVAYAIMESNGNLSIISKEQDESLPLIIVCNGSVYDENLTRLGISSQAFVNAVHRGGHKLKDIFLAYYDSEKKLHLYLQPRSGSKFAREVTR